MQTGHFMRWGEKYEDDPTWAPVPEILDLELSTICSGIPSKGSSIPAPCKHCYRSNKPIGKNMPFETFKKIIDKMPFLTQMAFGIGDIDAHPDFLSCLEFCRSKNIIGNYTNNGYKLTESLVQGSVSLAGAVAVSSYVHNKDVAYDAVSAFTEEAKRQDKKDFQVNIHCLLSKETLDFCYEVVNDSLSDKRLKDLNAIVFLCLKKEGRGKSFEYVDRESYKKFIDFLLKKNIRFGQDSCSAPNLLSIVGKDPKMREVIEPCCASCFSSYIDVNACYYPCSFATNHFDGIDVLEGDFVKDVWMNEKTVSFRNKVIGSTSSCKCEMSSFGCRKCPIYDVTLC